LWLHYVWSYSLLLKQPGGVHSRLFRHRLAKEIDDLVFHELVMGQPFRDWRLSRRNLASRARLGFTLRRSFGEARLEALDRELVVVSTDLYQRAAAVYHRLGPVADAVGASMSVPVLCPPRRYGARFLVDGSLSDHCPASVFSEVREGPVVVAGISPGSPNGSEDGGPTLGETLLRVVQMGERGAPATTAVPTLSVTPDTTGVGGLEFHQIDVARHAGRQAGHAVAEALQSLTHLPGRGLPGSGDRLALDNPQWAVPAIDSDAVGAGLGQRRSLDLHPASVQVTERPLG